MSPPAKSVVHELRTWMDSRLQEKLEAFTKNIQAASAVSKMVQTDNTTQLLVQFVSGQNARMNKLE